MIASVVKIFALSRIIFKDGLRRHALIGLLLLSLLFEASGLLFFDFIPRDIGRAATDFIFSISWISGFIFLFFHAVQVIAWDEEHRVIHTLLSRPISRGEYVIGVFSGLGFLLVLLNLSLGVIGWGILMLIQQTIESSYFEYFSHGFYIQSWLGLMTLEFLMLAVIIFFSGLIRGGFPVLLVSISFYLICSGIPVVREVVIQRINEGYNLLSYKLLQGMTLIFPNFERLDFKNFIVSDSGRPLFWNSLADFGLFGTYILLMLFATCAIYKKRDLQ